MAKSVCGAAHRIRSPGMFGPCHRLESTILVSNSRKLFCLLPALPHSSGVSQRRSGIESRGEARMRAHRGDSSGRRTSPSLPAPSCLVIVGPRRRWPFRPMKQSNLVESRDRIFLRTPRFAIQNAVAPLPYDCLDQFLQHGVSADLTNARNLCIFSSDGVFGSHNPGFRVQLRIAAQFQKFNTNRTILIVQV
jgi:hypothetical protein